MVLGMSARTFNDSIPFLTVTSVTARRNGPRFPRVAGAPFHHDTSPFPNIHLVSPSPRNHRGL